MSQIKKYQLRRIESLITKDRQNRVSFITFPNRLQVGVSQDYMAGFQVYGNASISGSAILSQSAYISFEKMGSSGYGFRDNAGTMQFKDSGGSWTDISAGGSGGSPGGLTTQVQFNDAGSFGGDGEFTWDKTSDTLTIGTALAGNGIVKVYDTISGSIHRTVGGLSYIVGGTNVTVASSSNGQITLSSTDVGSEVVSGTNEVAGVSRFNVTNLAYMNDMGGGIIALTGTIGNSEDGSYDDGLFTDFFPGTPVGTAIDRFNEVLKGLAPGAAPALDDMGCDDSGAGANLSFGSSQSIAGYTNVQPTGLSSPVSSLSDVDINGSYSSTTVSNDIRSACFAGSTTIEGTLNEDIPADGVNYPADSFGDGDQGTLSLFVNDNVSSIHSVDLSSFGSGDSLNANGSGFFDMSAADPAHFPDGSSFATFKHRTGSFRVSTTDQRNGWNYARVTHVVGEITSSCNYVEWVNDNDANALGAAGSALDTLSMTGLSTLSGVRYNTGGTAQYRVRVSNAYRNVYSQNNITFNGTNCSVPAQSFPTIDYASGENESKLLHLTGSATIDVDPVLNDSITVSVNVPHPLKSNISSGGSQSIGGILLYNLSNTSTVTSETFRAETYRTISGSYVDQNAITDPANTWSSSVHMSGTNTGYEDGLLFYNSRLYSPRQGGGALGGDFRNTADGGSVTNGPSENVNYSTTPNGTRTFFRMFQNNSGGSTTNFSITINGSGNIVTQGTALGTGNISVLIKLPLTNLFQSTGWMDLAAPFATGQTGDGDGCLQGALDSTLNATNDCTFGTVFIANSEYIMVKVEADASFTGYLNTISVSWG